MADVHGSPADAAQMPQAATAGSPPVPYQGAGQSPEPPVYAVDLGPLADAGDLVMDSIAAGNSVTGSASAHDIAAGLADAPYYPGQLSPINTMGDADAGGQDDVSGTVGAAVQAAEARFAEHQADTYGQGSTIGDLVHFPPSPLDPGAGVGNTMPLGAFYDPDRDYGGTQGAPGYQGEAI